tara:strand:- start:1340 stop:1834 length:495 start_codon:yes stop_codon:yes gene_type:complete
MRYYESLYIVNPNFEQGKLEEVMKTVTETISDYGFKTINHFVWGKKRLAYNIQEHKYGSYVLLHFETDSHENLDSFERFMVLQKPILRNQTVALQDKPGKQTEKAISGEEEKKDSSKDSSVKKQTDDAAKETEVEKSRESEQEAEIKETEAEEQAQTEQNEEND